MKTTVNIKIQLIWEIIQHDITDSVKKKLNTIPQHVIHAAVSDATDALDYESGTFTESIGNTEYRAKWEAAQVVEHADIKIEQEK